ncbi:DUF3035 domain-containing protein [Parvularcula lutaonensis]|uniref:DUF3035 domain-containing protein n=1 Tax=Parvularcula lutaonensis TaxID=491923 RepID=A0ABV7MHD5_9PROT|nr:DUF3035 domain-containing protein [Parvularcula lutaonensis]GGY54156.1 hypothetical protein GCM10007148_24620 [Parvularcula lutaonensis]
MRMLSLLALSAAALAACSSAGPLANRNAPDEFAVITKPPLTVPPDYALRPPRPGETRPEELSTTQRTQQLLLGDTSSEPPSSGELALIAQIGALDVDPSIRAILAAENGGRVEKSESLTNRLLFWNFRDGEVDDSAAPLVVEDREAWLEQRRQSIDSVTGPGATVTIARDERGVLRLPGVR